MNEREVLAKQTLHFLFWGSGFGMFLPLTASLLLFGIIGTNVPMGFIWVNLAYLFVCASPAVAYFIYSWRVDITGAGNWLLYIASVVAIILNVVMVQITGGFDKSVFKFFFFFIPSAVAISFHATRSMFIVGIGCGLGILFCYYDQPPHDDGLRWFSCLFHDIVSREATDALIKSEWFKPIYLMTMIIHLLSIMLLELVKRPSERLLSIER